MAPEPGADQDAESLDGALMPYMKFLAVALGIGGVLLIAVALWPTETTDDS